MKEKAPIKSASLKFEKQTPERQERLRQWLAVQGNYTESIFSLIEHMIDRFGYVDVRDHEVSKRLYLEQLTFNQNQPLQSPKQREIEINELIFDNVSEPRAEKVQEEKTEEKQRSKTNLDKANFFGNRESKKESNP